MSRRIAWRTLFDLVFSDKELYGGFLVAPVTLALGLGIALGAFVPVTVYNWERTQETYYPVLRLNQIETIV